MSKPWALVVPSSRGIGHHLTRALLRRTNLPVLATCRRDPEGTKAAILRDLQPSSSSSSSSSSSLSDRLHIARVDVTDEASVREAAEKTGSLFPRDSHHLRLAFALPGVLRVDKSAEGIDYDASLDSFRVNTLGPMLLMKHFVPFLPRSSTTIQDDDEGGGEGGVRTGGGDGGYGGSGVVNPASIPSSSSSSVPPHAVWVNMTARVGSVEDNKQGGWYTYRATKAAVNSLTRTLDWQLRTRASGEVPAMAVAYHPGTVKTDFSKEFWGGAEKRGQLMEVEVAAEKMLDVILGLKSEQRGRLWDWKGNEVPP